MKEEHVDTPSRAKNTYSEAEEANEESRAYKLAKASWRGGCPELTREDGYTSPEHNRETACHTRE